VSNVAVSELAWGTVGSPVGELSVACSAAGLVEVRFGPPPAGVVNAVTGGRARQTETPCPHPRAAEQAVTPEEAQGRSSGAPEEPGPPGEPGARGELDGAHGETGAHGELGGARGQVERACGQLGEYFAGQRRSFDLPVDWSGMSASQRQVLPVLLASAGYGETVTYGDLSRRAGVADGGHLPAARVTGQIMGSNPCPIVVPCHRVVASDGLGGYSGGAGIEIKRWLLIFEGALPPTLDWDPAGPGGI
jgi:methylated-DNA-[protein]-cysteine S-methyltransferase